MSIKFRIATYLVLIAFSVLSGILYGFNWEVYSWWLGVLVLATVIEVVYKIQNKK